MVEWSLMVHWHNFKSGFRNDCFMKVKIKSQSLFPEILSLLYKLFSIKAAFLDGLLANIFKKLDAMEPRSDNVWSQFVIHFLKYCLSNIILDLVIRSSLLVCLHNFTETSHKNLLTKIN